MPVGPSDILWIGVIPCAAAALMMVAGWRLSARPAAVWPAGVAFGLCVGMVALNTRLGWDTALDRLIHPRAAIDWLPWLVLIAASINLLAAYSPSTWQRWLIALACVFATTVPLRLLAGSVYVTTRWSFGEKLAVVCFWSLTFMLCWLTIASGRRNHQPTLRGGLLLVVIIGIALTVAASGTITLGELAGVAAATLLGTMGAALALGQIADGPSSAAGPLAIMLGGLILLAYFYAELSSTNAILLAMALSAATASLPKLPLPLGERWGEGALRAALTLLPLAVVTASAFATALSKQYG